MTLFSYVVDHDYGFAPNPYANTCVLSLCKYKKGIHGHRSIQDEANIGDWVVGTGGMSVASSGHDTLLYAMRITCIKPYVEYLASKEFSAKKSVGYGFEELIIDDTSLEVVPVLISDDFYYFGSQKQSLPLQFKSIQKRGPNFRKFSEDYSEANDLISWLRATNVGKGMIAAPCEPWLPLELS